MRGMGIFDSCDGPFETTEHTEDTEEFAFVFLLSVFSVNSVVNFVGAWMLGVGTRR